MQIENNFHDIQKASYSKLINILSSIAEKNRIDNIKLKGEHAYVEAD